MNKKYLGFLGVSNNFFTKFVTDILFKFYIINTVYK